MPTIRPFQKPQAEAVAALILGIQQGEFGVPITLADQPDLLDIPNFYQKNGGQFWVALERERVVGTAALIDCGSGVGCIRKMFVAADFRGGDHGLGQKLLDALFDHAREKGFSELVLGTRSGLLAAVRFYEKNGFAPVAPEDLPAVFPRMAVDDCFFKKEI